MTILKGFVLPLGVSLAFLEASACRKAPQAKDDDGASLLAMGEELKFCPVSGS